MLDDSVLIHLERDIRRQLPAYRTDYTLGVFCGAFLGVGLFGVLGSLASPNELLVMAAGLTTTPGGGAVGAGITASRARSAAKRNDAILMERHADLITAVEQNASALTTGLRRAWRAARAEVMANTAQEGLREYPRSAFAARLRAMANVSGFTDAEREEARTLHIAYNLVFAEPRHEAEKAAAKSVEHLIALLGRVSQEGRDILKPLITAPVLEHLDRDPGNHFRRQRFLEALDGKRTSYSPDGEQPVVTREVTPGMVRNRWSPGNVYGPDVVLPEARSAEDCVEALSDHLRVYVNSIASVLTPNTATATRVASYFEARGWLAALYQRGEEVRVTIYDPAHPPSERELSRA